MENLKKFGTESVSTTEVIEEKAYITWKIEGINDDTKWEAIKVQAKCFLELGVKTIPPQKLCFFLRDDGKCVGCRGLFCKTVTEYQHDVVLQVKIEKLNVDGSYTVILHPVIKTLKKESGRANVASCCVLAGNEAHKLFPGRSPPTTQNAVFGWTPILFPRIQSFC